MNRNMTSSERRTANRRWLADLKSQAHFMGSRLPKLFLVSGGVYLTAAQYASACRKVSQNLDMEFSRSFACWWAKKGIEIRREEILPALHERINCRPLIKGKLTKFNTETALGQKIPFAVLVKF